jgi:hypothetical protein
MTDTTKKAMTEDLRHLIYVQLQFDWRGETDLPADFMQRLDARGWIAEGENNGEFYITDEGEEAINTHLSAQREGDTVELVQQLRGRAKYLRDIGRIKSPQLMERAADAIDAHLSAQRNSSLIDVYDRLEKVEMDKKASLREGEAVAFTSIDDLERLHDDGGGIGRVEVNSRATAHRNVPLYISPPHPNLEVTEELAERVAEALQQNGWASGADYKEDFLPDVRAAVEAALSGNAP